MTGPTSPEVLDVLCPMHLVLDAEGIITHAGPTAQKLRPETELVGQAFMQAFTVMRPRGIMTLAQLWAARHLKLHLEVAGTPPARLTGRELRL